MSSDHLHSQTEGNDKLKFFGGYSMIRHISVNHSATSKDEILYKELFELIDFDERNKIKNVNRKIFNQNCPILSIEMYYIDYEVWGRIFFIDILVDFQILFSKYNEDIYTYENFINLLYKAYQDLFNKNVADRLIEKQNMFCTYVEFISFVKTESSNDIINQLKNYNFQNQQLDINEFENYRLKNASITFTVNAVDENTIRLCAKCPNTAIKKLFKITGLEHVSAQEMFNKDVIADILEKQIYKYTKPERLEIFSKSNILKGI